MTSTLTKGSPAKVILLFTLPLFVGNLFQQLYNAADTLIVGRTVGVDALGAVGSAGAVLNLVLWFSNGISAGCTIILAQRLGARDEKGMRCSIATTALLCGGMALLMTVCVTPFTRTLLIWMRTPEVQLDYAVQYLFVILCGTVVSDGAGSPRSGIYGKVTDVFPTGANDVYHVLFADGKTRYVPAIPQVVLETDLERRIMRIRPLDGLFED